MGERLEDILKKNVPPESPKEGVATPEAPTVVPEAPAAIPTLPEAAALKEMKAQAELIAIAAGIPRPLDEEVIKSYIMMRSASANGKKALSDQRVLAEVFRKVGDEVSLDKLITTHPHIWTELKPRGGLSSTEPKKDLPGPGIQR